MSWTEVVAVAVGVSAILAAGTWLVRVGATAGRGLRRLGRMLDDWLGEEPDAEGNTKRPGVLRRLDQIESGQRAIRDEAAEQARVLAEQAKQLAALSTRVARIEKELHGDGVGTFRDQVDKALAGAPLPKIEAGGTGFQAERAFEVEDVNDARVSYGFGR